jgi:hypothetical protein
MTLDIPDKAQQLLHALANSLMDRDTTNQMPIFFSVKEIELVIGFLNDLLLEYNPMRALEK